MSSARTDRTFLGRAIDIAAALLLLPLLGALLPVLWLLGKLHGHAGVFFRQERVGRHRRALSILKFRTMGERDGQPTCGLPFRLLRRAGLDELPQILLVLSGDMSLIGPRPLLARDLCPDGIPVDRSLDEAIRLRQSVAPGITGICQILDRRRDRRGGSYWRMLDADVWYVEHRSLGLDLLILVLTPLYALTGGAIRFPSKAMKRRRCWRLADISASGPGS